ncbi:hypothetical protein SAMN05421847_2939 [Halpernia humi]|uniref:Uncharacterized protein n=1 Tax=Halpernia humi TaxID=493375 RepID=A0A1H6BJN2_9FLAO|nr:hypothetical protein [Halpernia humi]SEG60939.1 hypothetical protein SAMN05421847_2939 [Halpernia humi]
MKAYINSNLPVFEADQVLSEKDLNSIISHLEEQDRITRKNLIGIGISCGLDLDFSAGNSVKIACGTAVTSLGFQINWAETTLQNYHNIQISDQFLKPDFIKEPFLDVIFNFTEPYNSIKNCVELLPKNSGQEDEKPIPAGFFDNKVVMLLLEIDLIDEKNCVTTNCDDKGKRLDFIVRPLLLPINEVRSVLLQEYPALKYHEKIAFPRYNVPFASNLTTPVLVLDGFRKVYDDVFISDVSAKISTLYDDFKSSLRTADLPILQSVKSKINASVNTYKSGINIQYLWDWISDIVEAYNEIVDFKELNPALCCVDESLFPFHVVLGGNSDFENTYRTPFFKTANANNKNKRKLKKLTVLFEKLALIISSFQVLKTDEIKITPSKYGSYALSKKAIPFYYSSVLDLNKKWNPDLTAKNQNDSILSYFSDISGYSDQKSVKNPLEFNIEPYNFFRIEGHLGLNYKSAIEEITLIRDSNNLPFKITALNAADFFNQEVDISNFDGRWDDLETDYDLARKRVFNITEFVINWMETKKVQLNAAGLIASGSIDNFKNILSQIKGLLTEDLMAFLPNCKSFNEIFKQLNLVFIYHRNCIQALHPTLSSIAEDLIDYLDNINELFLDDPFTVIFDEAMLRWQNIYKDLFFSTFVKKHPGLDHKAGVIKGGTFVLVYTDSSIFKNAAPPLTHQSILTAITAYKDNIPIEASVKEDLAKTVKLSDYKSHVLKKTNTEVLEKAKAETESIKNSLIDVATANLGEQYSPAIRQYILGNIKAGLQYEFHKIPQNNIPEQTIIADFFLPYTCCSEGTTLEVKFETKETSIGDFNPEDFNPEDFNTK